VADHGEPDINVWTFNEASTMVNQAGLEVVSNVDSDFLTQQYLIGLDGQPDSMMANFMRIIYARVP
jgi:hypothetical protein